MGFSAGLATKALLLSRNQPEAALEWALQHSDDADADAPASPEALAAGDHSKMAVMLKCWQAWPSQLVW